MDSNELIVEKKASEMGDSQNWSSFDDEPVAPKRRAAAAAATGKAATQVAIDEPVKEKSALDKLQSLDLRNFRNRLMFGGLVGFCTGATFGASTSNAFVVVNAWVVCRTCPSTLAWTMWLLSLFLMVFYVSVLSFSLYAWTRKCSRLREAVRATAW